ncbi:MAG: S1 RNA-binding domain-containing protein [Aggregatilineales bacterium]
MSEDVNTAAPTSIEALKPGMQLTGTVKRIELYGAFVDVGVGKDALLHISQLGKSVRNVEDVVKVGDQITVYILKVDKGEDRVALSMEKPPAVSWDNLKEGDVIPGKIVRIETFGVFVDIGTERPGMVHVSELAEGYVKSPSDVVSMDQEVEVRILKVNRRKRQIDLSMKGETPTVESYQDEDEEEVPTAMAMAFRRAMESSDEDLAADKNNRKRSKKRSSELQEDIIARTLRHVDSN